MKRVLNRHTVRTRVYHVGAATFATVALYYYFVLNNSVGWFDLFCVGYFIFDYAAEMYDPHPDTPGPWFKRHFHRFFKDDCGYGEHPLFDDDKFGVKRDGD